MTLYLADRDFTLHVGDVRTILPELGPGSVDCVITSPPYWGLRDYGTGVWAGGEPQWTACALCEGRGDEDCAECAGAGGFTLPCDHKQEAKPRKFTNGRGEGVDDEYAGTSLTSWTYRDATPRERCGRCGATRQDQQLGLEPTPQEYVENMVAVFRELRRVLADHGTCWVNLGDSYAASTNGGPAQSDATTMTGGRKDFDLPPRMRAGLKPKDLVGIPWRIAFALQNDGWYLRSDIIWAKPNPMPESVQDRPTKAHEYLFLLSKQPRYWFDADAVREPSNPNSPFWSTHPNGQRSISRTDRLDGSNEAAPNTWLRDLNPTQGRNIRSVWTIATQAFSDAHFATYPEELVRRALLAGCPEWVCVTCRKPRERIVGSASGGIKGAWHQHRDSEPAQGVNTKPSGQKAWDSYQGPQSLGWSNCGHGDFRPGVCLDPFLGSGTTALVARRHGRHCVGIELNPDYAALAARRTQQLSMLAELLA